MSIRVLIIDDESLARESIRLLLKGNSDFEIIGECKDGKEAITSIRELNPDLVFLDVQMPEKNGFEVVQEIGFDKMPQIIFATAFDQYAVSAFEAHAVDYLLKPFDDERFERALARAKDILAKNQLGQIRSQLASLLSETKTSETESNLAEKAQDRIMIKERGSILFVKTEDIDWVEAAGDYVVLHVDKKKHMLRESMTGMEQKLDSNKFARIHRSTIVNLERIKELKPYFHGDYLVYLHNGKELKLSRRYWAKLETVLGK